MALADTFIRAVKHSGKKGHDKHSDALGLYLAVSPSGGKLWRMDYRHGGKRKTLSLGAYPAISLVKARKARDAAREQLAEGIDPSEAKQAGKAAQTAAQEGTVEAVGRAWLANRKDSWSNTHYIRELRNLEKDLFPYLGARAIGTVEPPELLRVIRKVEERGALEHF